MNLPEKVWRAGTLTYTRRGIALLFAGLLWGDFAWGMKTRAVGYVSALTVKSFGISDFMYGLLMVSFPCFTNIFMMPAISYCSDRHRGRLGRRIPFLLWTTPFVVIGLAGLGVSPMLGQWISELAGEGRLPGKLASLIVFACFWIVLDFGTTLTNAIFGALANDVVPEELIGRFLSLFRMVTLSCAILFNFFLLGYAERYAPAIFIGLAVLYGVGLFSMCAMVREGSYPPPPREPKSSSGAGGHLRRFSGAVKIYFRECFALPYYRWVIAAQVCCINSVMPVNMYALFYAKSLNLDLALFGKICAGIFLVSVLLSFFLGVLADRFHPLRAGIVCIGVLAAVQISGGFLIRGASGFLTVFAVHEVVIMSYNTLMASYGQRLFPKTYFAQFNSALQMLNAVAAVLLAPAFGWILDRLGHDYSRIFLMGSVLSVAGFCSLLVVFRYFMRLGGDRGYRPPMVEEK